MKTYLLNKFKIGWIDIEIIDEIPEGCNVEDHYLSYKFSDGKVGKYSSEDYGTIRVNRRIYEYRMVCRAGIQEGSRKTSHHIVKQLIPEMQYATAGVTADKANYITPKKLTIQRTLEVMDKGKWYRPSEILDALRTKGYDHHYSKDSTYKASIGGWLVKFGHAEASTEWHKSYKLIDLKD
jgi:hypothetical protein